ncbi:hypothetical protein D3C72_2483110 [compost metagenome]
MPLDAGLGITTWPLNSGLVRSCQLVGTGILRFFASTVLKQMVAPNTSMPTQCGGFLLSRYLAVMASRPLGA